MEHQATASMIKEIIYKRKRKIILQIQVDLTCYYHNITIATGRIRDKNYQTNILQTKNFTMN